MLAKCTSSNSCVVLMFHLCCTYSCTLLLFCCNTQDRCTTMYLHGFIHIRWYVDVAIEELHSIEENLSLGTPRVQTVDVATYGLGAGHLQL